MADDNTRHVLEKLIDINRDGEKGYCDAAEHITDAELRSIFHDQCAERARFADELQQALHRLGKWETTRQGSAAGALHRAWFDIKEKFSGNDQDVLEYVEQGEDAAKKAYEEALRELLPEDVMSLVRGQAQSIIAAHDYVRLVRDRRKAA